MKSEERNHKKLWSTFEEAAYEQDGIECWFARDLQVLLTYDEWRNFKKVIGKAKTVCLSAGLSVDDHFVDSVKGLKESNE